MDVPINVIFKMILLVMLIVLLKEPLVLIMVH